MMYCHKRDKVVKVISVVWFEVQMSCWATSGMLEEHTFIQILFCPKLIEIGHSYEITFILNIMK